MLFDVPVMTRSWRAKPGGLSPWWMSSTSGTLSWWSAAVPLYDIYQGERLKFEFQRCLSRLQEMQSEEYLKRPHMP
jgi:cell division protein ZapE